MATTLTLDVIQYFPVGTTLGAYSFYSEDPDGTAPPVAATSTAVVAADGTVAFTGLAAGTRYWVGTGSSPYRFVGASTTPAAASGGSGTASGVAFTPAGSIAATDVQAAVSEVATDAIAREAALAPLASPTFTGTPAAPTAAAGTSTTQVATTAFVIGTAKALPMFTSSTAWATLLPGAGTPGGATNVGPGIGQISTYPFVIDRALTLTGMGLHVWSSGVASSALRVGIYNDSSRLPGSLVADLGTLAMTAGGVVSATISQALTAGRYWLAYVQQGGASVAQSYGGGMLSLLDDTRNVTFPASGNTGYFQSSASTYTGALPTPFPALSTTVGTNSGMIRIMFQAT